MTIKMKGNLSPTQIRLIETAQKKGKVEVRTLLPMTTKAGTGQVVNAYDAKALHDLHDLGILHITCCHKWTSGNSLGTTYVAKVPGT
jgi:hypothetical protein